MSATKPTVCIEKVGHRYGATTALDGVSFALGSGVTGLLGPNGAGKTSLIRIMATAMVPDTGSLELLGMSPSSPHGRTAIRRKLGYMPQEPGFYTHFTAQDFVEYVAILNEISGRRERIAEAARVLDLVGLTEHRQKRVKALSGGMRQRLALACALVADPSVLILDEPMVGLDPEQRLRLRELIAGLAEDRTVLLSTHQTEDVMTLCQRVIILNQGRVLFDDQPNALARAANGLVWRSGERPADAVASWRTGEGSHRNLGIPPAGAQLVEPTLEDGYLAVTNESFRALVEGRMGLAQ